MGRRDRRVRRDAGRRGACSRAGAASTVYRTHGLTASVRDVEEREKKRDDNETGAEKIRFGENSLLNGYARII